MIELCRCLVAAKAPSSGSDEIKEVIVYLVKEEPQTLSSLGRSLPIGKQILMLCVGELVNQEQVLSQDASAVLHYVEPKK